MQLPLIKHDRVNGRRQLRCHLSEGGAQTQDEPHSFEKSLLPAAITMNLGSFNNNILGNNRMIETPTQTDVLFGRGVATNRHPGNENFRNIISQHVDVYVASTKKQKMNISRSIVDRVRKELDPPGRFLEKDSSTGLYREVEIKKALEKTAQTLRDLAAPLRKQLSEDFSNPSFLTAIFDGNDSVAGGDPLKRANGLKGTNNKPRGHRRTKTAPARDLALPLDLLPPSKKLCSKANSPVGSPAGSPSPDCGMSNLNVENLTPVDVQSNGELKGSSSLELFLANDSSPRIGALSNRNANASSSSSKGNKGHHRRHRTFGGYSCSDSNAANFLSKDDLTAGIPPLFASQLPESAQQAVARALHPLTPSPSPGAAQQSTATSSRGRHRRHKTMDSYSFTPQSAPAPVFSDDPTLSFNFLNGNGVPNSCPNLLTDGDSASDGFSLGNLPNMLDIPELPELQAPVTTNGGKRRHRRMHTTGDLLGGNSSGRPAFFRGTSMPLDPVSEETASPSIDSIFNSLQPIDHEPRRASLHEPCIEPSPSDMDGILSALGSISEDDPPRDNSGNKSGSLTDMDFLSMMKATDQLNDIASVGESNAVEQKAMSPEPMNEPIPFVPIFTCQNSNSSMQESVDANLISNHEDKSNLGRDQFIFTSQNSNSSIDFIGDNGDKGNLVRDQFTFVSQNSNSSMQENVNVEFISNHEDKINQGRDQFLAFCGSNPIDGDVVFNG